MQPALMRSAGRVCSAFESAQSLLRALRTTAFGASAPSFHLCNRLQDSGNNAKTLTKPAYPVYETLRVSIRGAGWGRSAPQTPRAGVPPLPPANTGQPLMPRPRKDKEPLIVVPLRLPVDFVAQIDAQANAAGLSRSDELRKRLISGNSTENAPAVALTGKPTPAKRERLKKASRADPRLLIQLASMGNNLNQIARTLNANVLAGTKTDALAILIQLEALESQLSRLSAESGG